MKAIVDEWCTAGWAAPWQGRFGRISGKAPFAAVSDADIDSMAEDFFGLPGSSAPVYAGVGGMQRLPRAVLDASGARAFPDCGCAACAQSPIDISLSRANKGAFAEGSLADVAVPAKGAVTVAVAQKHGTPNYALVQGVNKTRDVAVGGLDASGGVIGSPEDLWTAPAGDQVGEIDVSDALDLDALDPTYAVVFERTPSLVEDTLVMFCRNGNRVGTPRELQLSENADMDLPQGAARIGTTAADFIVTYQESDALDPTTFITTFDLTEGRFIAISERRTLVTELPSLFSDAPIASRFSGGYGASRIASLGWSEFDGTDHNAHGARFIADAPLAQAFQYGYGNPNSTGDRSFLTMYGDRSTTALKTLRASALPAASFGFFICGPNFNNVPNPGGSEGVLLVGGSIGRYVAAGQIKSSGANGSFSLEVDPTDLPQPTGSIAVTAGEVWQFQAWHRDSSGGVPTSNFTNGVTMLFR